MSQKQKTNNLTTNMTLPTLIKLPARLFQTIIVFCLTLLGSLILTANPASANELSDQFTISLWVKPEGSVASKALVAKAEEIRLVTNGSGNPLCQVKATSWQTAVTSSTAIPLNDWSHVTCVYDKATLRIFVNGVQTGSQALTVTVDSTSNVFKIGQDSSSGTTYGDLMGVVDNFLAYDYVRTSQQIVEDMNAGHPPPGSPIGSPLVHFKFDEGFGDIINNAGSGGNSLNGDLAGTCPGTATCPSWTNDGKMNKALTFDGGDDFASLVLPQGIIDTGTSSFSISTWIKRNGGLSPSDLIAAKPGYHGGLMGSSTGADIRCNIANTSNQNISVYSNSLTQDVWYHAVCLYDQSTSTVQLYIDGALMGSALFSGDVFDYTDNFLLGGYGSIQNSPVSLDELKIYTFALTADQVKAEYNMGKATVLGALSTTATGVASNASDRSYCPPGDSTGSCGPVAEWKFDENTGTTTVNDTSGNAKHGTMNGGMTNTNWVPGKVGSALSFDGVDDYVSTSDIESIEGITQLTVAAWIYPKAWNLNDFVVEKGNVFVLGSHSYIGSNGGFMIRENGTSNWKKAELPTSLSLNTWHYLVGVYDGQNIKVYLDGKLSTVGDAYTNIIRNEVDVLNIGGRDTTYPFDGNVDQVRIYNYARTPAQIAWDYNRGKPVAHYKLDECSGTTIRSSNDPYNSALDGTWSGSGGSQTSAGDCSAANTAWANGATGKLNASLNFDGTDDRVLVSQPVTQPHFSYSFWMKPSSIPGSTAYIVSEGFSYTNSNHISLNSAGNLDFRIFASQIATNNAPISVGNWYHVVGTYDGTNGRLYINGKLVKQEAANKSGTPDRFAIGGGTSGTDYFSGQIDDVQIFNYALTPQQIQTVMNSGAIRYGE